MPHSVHLITQFILVILSLLSISLYASDHPTLTLDYYASTCPKALEIVRREMECAVLSDPRNAALIVRLHFHDCFVQGCDGSVLLDDTITLLGEKTAIPNFNSIKGFELIDTIKNKLESECPEIVSCADILAIAARDGVVLVGGPFWDVPLGRKDSRTASYELATLNIPMPDEDLLSIIGKFLYQGLSVTDTVALSGSHTIGMARCENFRSRIYYDLTTEEDPSAMAYFSQLKGICGPIIGMGDNNITALDHVTPVFFDNSYFNLLLKGEGLLNSDQELFSSMFGLYTKELVKKYALDGLAFFEQFSESMVKMGNIANSDIFFSGEIRKNCRFVNSEELNV